MRQLVKSILSRNPNLRALVKPFLSTYSDVISEKNRMIDAYIYDYDREVSSDNHVVAANFVTLSQEVKRKENNQ